MIQSETMEQTVRDILASRTVRLEPIVEKFQVYGFRCLGIAEKILDFDDVEDSSPVYVWHVQDDILPLSKNEIERWSVDVPGKRHWILSEREFNEDIFEDISNDFQIDAWGPKKLSRWIGEAVLRGDLTVSQNNVIPNPNISDIDIKLDDALSSVTLTPLIELNEWLDKESMSMLNTLPVLINVKLWNISGIMLGPNSDRHTKQWSYIEDPWSKKIYLFNDEEVIIDSPNLRKINPLPNSWENIDSLKTKLQPLLDFRQKEKLSNSQDKVRSTMLEWWRVDLDTLSLESSYAQIPAWILMFEDGGKKILHSRNGQTYEISH